MDPISVTTSLLTFSEIRAGSELEDFSDIEDVHLLRLLSSFHNDFSNANYYAAFVGKSQQSIKLIAPHLYQKLELPIRLGEKVICRIDLPAMRFLPSAQQGVKSTDNALELLKWLQLSHPKLTLVFTDLITDAPLYIAITNSNILGYQITNNQPAPHLFHDFRSSYEEFFQEKQSKYKNQLRKKEKVFREKFGSAFTLREYRLVEDIQWFFDAAYVINIKTYQNKLFGETVDNLPQTIKYYSEIASQGYFRSFILWHDTIPLCFVLGRQGEDGVFQHQKTGFDPDWREHSPGIFCNILMLQHLYENDRPKILDFGSGDAEYKRLFANKTEMSASPVLVPISFRYSLIYSIYTVLVIVNDTLVRLVDKIGLKEQLKRYLRRIS